MENAPQFSGSRLAASPDAIGGGKGPTGLLRVFIVPVLSIVVVLTIGIGGAGVGVFSVDGQSRLAACDFDRVRKHSPPMTLGTCTSIVNGHGRTPYGVCVSSIFPCTEHLASAWRQGRLSGESGREKAW